MYKKVALFILIGLLTFQCVRMMYPEQKFEVEINNPTESTRINETVTIDLQKLGLTNDERKFIWIAKAEKNDSILISQCVDIDLDGYYDELLIQPFMSGHETKIVSLMPSNSSDSKIDAVCYSRFVPERTDDYAWENDVVAFRTFGPTAQKMQEKGVSGGTLSSGIDAWLKKVGYPVIDKWYIKELETEGSYHVDTGEGLDNFHVGKSRGVGGLAIKSDTSYLTSKNFISSSTLYNGPIRTKFILNYAPWGKEGAKRKEQKIITLDRGQHLSKIEVHSQHNNLSAGLTLHENDGQTISNVDMNWIAYWQPHGDSELGTAIITDQEHFKDVHKYVTPVEDLSNFYLELKPTNDSIYTYYSGFAWKEQGSITSGEAWRDYLDDFSSALKNPLKVEYPRKN